MSFITEKDRKRAKATLDRLGRIAIAGHYKNCLWALKTSIERTLQANVPDSARKKLIVEMESALRTLRTE